MKKLKVHERQTIKRTLKSAWKAYTDNDYDKAERLFKKILEKDNTIDEAFYGLGSIAYHQKEYTIGALCMKGAVELKPDDAQYRYELGIMYDAGKHWDLAIEQYRKAIQLDHTKAEYFNELGAAFKSLNQPNEAIAAFTFAIEINPELFEAYHNRGVCKASIGDDDGSREDLEKSVELNPYHIPTWRSLISMKKFNDPKENAEMIEKMHGVIKGARHEEFEKGRMYFGIAKIYEDIENWPMAFNSYKTANDIIFNDYVNKGFDLEELIKFNKKIMTVFDKNMRVDPNADNMPLYIIGMPRSGTTLIDQVLATHSLVHSEGELNNIPDFCAELQKEVGLSGIHPKAFPQLFDQVSLDRIIELGDNYVKYLHERFPGKRYMIDKTPSNYYNVGLIKALSPNTKFIHCKRDPMACCVSNYRMVWSVENSWQYTYDLESLGRYYKEVYEPLMEHWESIYPESFITLQYEDMVDDFDNQVRRILDFLDLEWEDGLNEFYNTERAVWTASITQVRKPVYRSGLDSWKKYEKWLSPLRNALDGKVLSPKAKEILENLQNN